MFQPSCRPPNEFGKAPARLLSLRLPSLPELLTNRPQGAKCKHPRGSHRTLLDKDENDRFFTADKKTYPSALCECLARAIYQD
eukprot:8380156-Pyramimonas_sp.AAC.1